MQREQKTGEPGWTAGDRVEPEGTQGAQSTVVRKATNGDSALILKRVGSPPYSKGMRNYEKSPNG